MTTIPDDIMKAAREAAHAFLGMAPCYPEQFQLQDTIARAIMAERERCAKVAKDSVAQCDEDTPGGWCAANQARSIAAAIEEGAKP